jgi:hypothetical protein
MQTTVSVALFESGADDARLDHLGRQLRSDLLRLDTVDDVTVARGDASGHSTESPPTGSRGFDPATASTLAVALLGSGGISALIGALRQWLSRGAPDATRTVRVEVGGDVLEVTGASQADQQRVIDQFLQRLEAREVS